MADYLRESGVKWIWEKIKTLLSAKQDTLMSGTNIKTINGNSLLGSGDVSISGGSGGDFNESGTYPNLTAGKATKLATARKIGITGGAVGTATSFDGSKDVSIPVTKIDEGVVTYVEEYANISGGSILDSALLNSQINAFSFIPPSAISVEYSTDNGSTWLDYGLTDKQKILLCTPISTTGASALYLGKKTSDLTTQDKLRITIDFITADITVYAKKLLVKNTNYPGSKYHMSISYELYDDYKEDVWALYADYAIKSNNWQSYSMGKTNIVCGYEGSGALYPARIRLEFYRIDGFTRNTNFSQIACLFNIINKGNEMARTGRPYTLDWQKNTTFPAQVIAPKHVTSGGTNQQVVLGDGSLRPISELSPITDADAEILLDNHIHSINVNTNGNDVNISVIESSKNGNTWETEDNDITIPLATPTSAGLMSKDMYSALKDGFIANIVEVTTNGNSVELSYDAAYPNSDGTFYIAEGEGVEIPLATTTTAGVMSAADKTLLNTHTTKIASAEDNITDLIERVDSIDEQIVNLDDQASAAASSISSLNTRVSTLEGASGGSNIGIDADSGMPDLIGDYGNAIDYIAEVDLTTMDWITWVENGLYILNAEETQEEDNTYHQSVLTFIYRSSGCIPVSIVNTNRMEISLSGTTVYFTGTDNSGWFRIKQVKAI